jgi:hypothetical protein
MASAQVVQSAFTVNGTSNGVVTVASTALYVVGATVYIYSATVASVQGVIESITDATHLVVKSPTGYTRLNLSTYLVANTAVISQQAGSAGSVQQFVPGDTSTTGSSTVGGNATIGGTLAVTGNATFAGNAVITGTCEIVNQIVVDELNLVGTPPAGVTFYYQGHVHYATAAIIIDHTAWTANALTQDIIIANFPPKCKVVSVLADTTIAHAGTTTMTLAVGVSAGGTEYLLPFNVKTINTAGLVNSDLGTHTARANAVMGGDWLWTGPTPLYIRATATGTNLGNGTVTNTTTGSTTIYISVEYFNI